MAYETTPRKSNSVLYFLVGGLLVAVAFVVYFLFGGMGGSDASRDGAVSTQSQSAPAPTDAPAAPAPAAPAQ